MAKRVKYGIPDDESPEITPELFAKMRPMKEVAPDLVAAHKALRGRPKAKDPKAVVSIRLSGQALKRWKSFDTAKRKKLVAMLEKKIASAA